MVEACEATREQLNVRNVESSQVVRHADLKRSLHRLLAAKEEEENFIDLSGLSLCFHHKAHHYRFDEVTGELELPVNWEWYGLHRALGTVQQDLVAFQGNFQLLPGLPGRLQEAGVRVKGFEVDEALKHCITFQAHCFKELIKENRLFQKFDLSFLTIRISDRFKLDAKSLVLSIPWDFSVDELIAYLEQWQAPPDPGQDWHQLGAGTP